MPKQPPPPEVPHTYAKCLRSLPGILCLAEGAVCDCDVMGFPINKECCQGLQLSKYTLPQEELPGGTPLKRYLPPSLHLMSGENETCANAQWLVDRTTSDGSVYVLSLAGAQIANMELDIAPEELAYLN